MASNTPFILDEKLIEEFKGYNPFTQNVVGYIAFQRSYSRTLPNGRKRGLG